MPTRNPLATICIACICMGLGSLLFCTGVQHSPEVSAATASIDEQPMTVGIIKDQTEESPEDQTAAATPETATDPVTLFRDSHPPYTVLVFVSRDCVVCKRPQMYQITSALVAKRWNVVPVWCDREFGGRIAESYNVAAYPTFLAIDGAGHERGRIEGLPKSAKAVTDLFQETRTVAVSVGVEIEYPSQPARGRYWTINGDPEPSREEIIDHLLSGAYHRGKFTREQLSGLTWQQLMALHADDHEGAMRGEFAMSQSQRCPDGRCPDGRCPETRRR